MDNKLSAFFNGFYLNYWNDQCHPVIRQFVEIHLSFLANSGEWTAYFAEAPDETLIEQKPVSISFKEHPNWKSHYEEVCFAALLKMVQGKCIGLYAVQLVFSYPTEQSLHQAVDGLISFCKQKDPSLTIRKTKNALSIHATEGTEAHFKTAYHAPTQKQRLFFCTVPFFFEYD